MEAVYLDHMGTDLTVVNAARVSMSKTSDWEYDMKDIRTYDGYSTMPNWEKVIDYSTRRLCEGDKHLIQFLARGMSSKEYDRITNMMTCVEPGDVQAIEDCMKKMAVDKHWTPFGHCQATFRIKVPIFVARQLRTSSVGFVANEVSRRYVDDEPEFFMPDAWRIKAKNVKQGSGEDVDIAASLAIKHVVNTNYKEAAKSYQWLLDEMNVAPELARMVLPQSMYTEWWWTGSLMAWSRLCKQRLDPHAQYETRMIAEAISKKMTKLFPVSWTALIK